MMTEATHWIVFEFHDNQATGVSNTGVWGVGDTREAAIEDGINWYQQWHDIQTPPVSRDRNEQPVDYVSGYTPNVLYITRATEQVVFAIGEYGGQDVQLMFNRDDNGVFVDLPIIRVKQNSGVIVNGCNLTMFITDENGKEWLVDVDVENPFGASVADCDIVGRQLSRTSVDDIEQGLSIQTMKAPIS